MLPPTVDSLINTSEKNKVYVFITHAGFVGHLSCFLGSLILDLCTTLYGAITTFNSGLRPGFFLGMLFDGGVSPRNAGFQDLERYVSTATRAMSE